MPCRGGLRRADEWGLESLTVLPFGLGPGGLEVDEAARITARVLHEHLQEADTLGEIVIAVSTDYQAEAYQRQVDRVFGPRDDAV